jgi:hypothetical protein
VSDPLPPLDLDAILEQIRQTVDANTASGVYDEDLESELRSHYARVLSREDRRDRFDSLRVSLEKVEERRGFSSARIATVSGVPGGEVLHRTAARIVGRQVNGLVEQLNDFGDALMPALNLLANSLSDPRAHAHEDLVHELDTLQDRVAVVERALGRIQGMVEDLERVLPRVLDRLDHTD